MNVASALRNSDDDILDAETIDPAPLPETKQAVAVRTEADTPRAMTPMELVSYAIQSGQPIDIIREAIKLSKELKSDQALEAFDAAVADAKAEIGPAMKNKTGNNSKRYADFAAYAAVVDPIIGKHGLSYRFRTRQDGAIHVTCVLSHRAGHREETTLSGPADATGSKNAIQAIGSTLTYLQRYTLVQALGLAAAEDDDGKAAGEGDASDKITDEQVKTLLALIEEVDAVADKFCEIYQIDAVPHLPAKLFDDAVNNLRAYGRRNKK